MPNTRAGQVHGKGDRKSPIVVTEMHEIRELCEFERQNKDVNYFELFKPNMINRTFIGMFTQIWSQLTGMNIMSMSAHTLPSSITLRLTEFKCIISPSVPNGWVFR